MSESSLPTLMVYYSPWSIWLKSCGRHWLVWTLLPLVDWKKATPYVQQRGLAGRYSSQRPELRIETEGYQSEGVCQELEAFAEKQWPDATDVMWLVNPVKLQSVPALVSSSYNFCSLTAAYERYDMFIIFPRRMLMSS